MLHMIFGLDICLSMLYFFIFQTSVDENNNLMEVNPLMTFGELVGFANIKTLHTECSCTPEPTDQLKPIDGGTTSTKAAAVDTLNILMAGAKCHPKKKTPASYFEL